MGPSQMHQNLLGGLIQAAAGTNGLITSVNESRENLVFGHLMPLPPKFNFQARQGRINWRTIMNTDIEKIVSNVDLLQLESLLQNLTYANLDREDLERLGDTHFIKLFRLSQMSIEYLVYTQNYLETLTKTLDLHYKHAHEETAKIRDLIKKQQTENIVLKKELRLKQKTLSTYEYLLKLPAEQGSEFYKCKQCAKFFISKKFLQKHYGRSHPKTDFYADYKTDADFEKHPNPHVITEQTHHHYANTMPNQPTASDMQLQIHQNEMLFIKIREELQAQLSENLKKVNNEISEIRSRQTMMSTMDSRKTEEQRQFADSL